MHPLFPNLPLFQANIAAFARDETEPIAAPRTKSVDKSSQKAKKDHVGNKWVKTTRGSIRLASDTPAEASKDATDNKSGDNQGGHDAPSAAATRRSRRLASMSPDVAGEASEVEPPRPRRPVAVRAEAPPPVTAGSDEPQEWEEELEPALPDCSAKSTTETSLTTQPTHHDGLPIHDGQTGHHCDPKSEHLKNITPIPELVADIERIVLSSPLAARYTADDGTKGSSSPTPAPAVKQRAPAGMITRSRALRSSLHSTDSPARVGKGFDLEQVDSDSQFDGAYDDSIRGQMKKKAQVKSSKANMNKPRGTKRRAQELSESEPNVPSRVNQQRRNPASHRSTPEVDLSSSNPIEAATSRDAFAVDDPNVEMAVGIGEFARRSGEPPNPVTLAQMISSNNSPERAERDDDSSILVSDVSQRSSSPGGAAVSDVDSTRGHHGSAESSRPPSPEVDRPTCGDCGRAPERFIVCAKCLVVVYCGKYCQLWNWPAHKARCEGADEAVQEEVDEQERYLGDMWAAALRMLEEEENSAGGTVESLLLDEAVHHSGSRPSFVGQGRPVGLGGMVAGAPYTVPRDSELMNGQRAMAIQLAQAGQGGDD